MQSLNLDEEPTKRPGFWRRQFQQTSTRAQKKFDWAFGVVIPTMCVLLDPIVFRGGISGTALLGDYKPFAYVLSFVSILGMAAWLIWGERLRSGKSFLGGLFFTGSLVSFAVGLILLPFSLIGLIFVIGALGLTPLFASFVFLRNGVRATRASATTSNKLTLVHGVALSALLSFAVPFTINAEIRSSLDAIRDGDLATIRRETGKLRTVAPLVDFDIMARERFRKDAGEMSTPELRAVDEFYLEMTGSTIENSRWIND
jgi:hypothetical protein